MDERSPGAGRRVVAAGVLAAMLAALVYVAGRGPAPTADVAVAPAAAPAEEPAVAEEAKGGDAPAPPVASTAPDVLPPTQTPTFDVVRVSPDGSALVAGRAAPGAVVTIMVDDAPLAEAQTDAEGNFVAIFNAEPSGTPQALTLEAEEPEGGTANSEEVVMLLPEAPAGAPEPAAAAEEASAAPTAAEPGKAEPVVPAEPGQAEMAARTDALAGPAAGQEPTVAATAIVRPDAVQAAPTGASSRNVTVASIAYAEQGEVTLAGLGAAGAVVRLYVDDTFAREGAVGVDGRWSMELGDVAEGVYRLRIDQLGADGRVVSRVETPFQRDYPRPPVPRPGGGAAGTVTVQPGHNLWTLARLHYGKGVHYTQIFTANRAQIRDPDLIYPGQIFAMPEMTAE